MEKLLRFIIHFSLLVGLCSCLSSNEDEIDDVFGGQPSVSTGVSGSSGNGVTYTSVNFTGVDSAASLTQSSVRVFFPSATGGSGIYTYTIFLNNNFVSPYQNFGLGQYTSYGGGLYGVDVTGLSASTNYNISVRVLDVIQGTYDTNTKITNITTPAATAAFGGIDSIDNVTSTTMRLNWTSEASASAYNIYRINGASVSFVNSVSNSNTSYTITNLEPSTNYTYRVRYVDSDGYTDDNTNDVTQATAAALAFAGATSVTNVTTSSMQINWTHIGGASSYKVYLSSDLNTSLYTVTAPTNYFVVTGLTPNTGYSYVVRSVDSNGGEDSNTNAVSGTTLSFAVTHNGWSHVYSVGPRVDFQGTTTETENITLTWRQMTTSSGTLTGYNLYYSDSVAGTYTKINGSAIADGGGADITYSIPVGSLTPGKVYWFKVSAIVDGVESAPTPTAPTDHTVIRILYPPQNMALVHRWIVNRTTCNAYQRDIGATKGVDVANHYRCEFNGLGSTDDGGTHYYDIGKDLIVDVNELGCNFSVGACTSHSVGTTTTTDCVGNGGPGSLQAAQNSIYYGRSYTAGCYIQTSSNPASPNWVKLENMDSNTDIAFTGNNYGSYLAANKVNLPSIKRINLSQAYRLCESQTVDIDISGSSTTFRKRTLRRKEYAAASWWPSTLTGGEIYKLESEVTANSCNIKDKTVGSANLPAYSDSHWVVDNSSNNDSRMPAGTSHTSACRSRFGVQDMVGNVSEIVTDHIQGYSSNPYLDMENTTPLFDSNFRNDWVNGNGDYLKAHLASSGVYDQMYTTYNSNLDISSGYQRYINLPMGIILRCSANCSSDDLLVSHASYGTLVNNYQSGAFVNFDQYTYYDSNMRMMVMGHANEYVNGSRFAHYVYDASSSAGWRFGTRCMTPYSY